MFPDSSPVSDIIGVGFNVAGAVQKGIQDQSIYLGDVKKSLKNTLKELNSTKLELWGYPERIPVFRFSGQV